mgnify:FL=1
MKQTTKKKLNVLLTSIAVFMLCSGVLTSVFGMPKFNGVFAETGNGVYTAEVTPYIEYAFDSVETFLKNTGSSAKDSTKDYNLKINGNASASDLYLNGVANFTENASLYIPYKNNPFISDLTDFTIAVDVNAGRPASYYGSVFSWDSFSSYNDNASYIDSYHRINHAGANISSNIWFRLGDMNWKSTDEQKKQYQSWAGAKDIFERSTRTDKSGETTIVYSLSAGKTLRVTAYQNGEKVSNPATSIVQDISSWSLYKKESVYKTFMIGGCYDSRYITSMENNVFTQAQKMVGTMDNIRVYDFAMTESQMAEYAATKKISVPGIQIEKTENGTVSVENYTPQVGEEVIINVTPNADYEIEEVTVNGVKIEAVNGVYKTTMVENGLSISATFKETVIKKLKVVSMAYGAGIRCGGDITTSGLRFSIAASKEKYETVMNSLNEGTTAEFGILIIPEDYQKTYGAFTVENLFGENAKYHLAERNPDGSLKDYDGTLPQIINFVTNGLYLNEKTGNYEYFGSITGILDSNLTRKFVGVGFVKYTDGETAQHALLDYADGNIVNNTRSVYQVAKIAELNDNLPAEAKTWIRENYINVVESKVTALNGKKLSILGDSISTFKGVSNNAETNSTIGNNEVFYGAQNSVLNFNESDTWWKQSADKTGASVLVNNSWAGANVATNYGNGTKGGCTARAENLHDVNNVNPDIVAVYMGINDCGCLTGLGEFNGISDIWDGEKYIGNTELFATAYATMVHKIVTKYGNAKVFLFTLPQNGYHWLGTKEEYNALQVEYNKMIYKIAEVFNVQVVDLATMVGGNYGEYLLQDGIHPNEKGMDIISAAFETALYSFYSEK